MQLAGSILPVKIRRFMRSGSSLSMLKTFNAILLVLLGSFMLPSTKKAYAYTVLSASWPGTSTTYSNNANLGSFYSIAVDQAANDWSSSSSTFDFVANSASANNIRFDALSPLGNTAISYTPATRTINSFIISIDNSPPYPWWIGGVVPPNYYDFRTVVRHELGHALGLGHADVSGKLMYPSVPNNWQSAVDTDAINGSRFMYDSTYTGSPPERSYYGSTLPPYSGPGTYDDQSTAISYGGLAPNWLTFNPATNAGFSTISRTGTIGSRAHIALGPSTVNKITLFYTTGPDRRNADVYIDQVKVGSINAQTTEYRRQVGKTWAMTSATSHSFEVRFGPNAGLFDVDMFAVNIATVGSGTYNDTHAQLRYFGTWVPTTGISGAYNDDHTISNTAGSLFRFAFDGNQVTYYYTTAYNRGKAAITIDGVDKGYIDMYTLLTYRQQSTTFNNLGPGTHVLNVHVTGQKNLLSLGTYVDVDALNVQ